MDAAATTQRTSDRSIRDASVTAGVFMVAISQLARVPQRDEREPVKSTTP